MTDEAEYIVHEGYKITVYADVTYQVHPGYDGGRHEPSANDWVEVISATLRQVEEKPRFAFVGNNYAQLPSDFVTTDLGAAPEWVLKLIERDTDWKSDLIVDDSDDSDYRYDSRRDEEAA